MQIKPPQSSSTSSSYATTVLIQPFGHFMPVNRRATLILKVHNALKNMEYSNRLETFKMTTLEKRSKRNDLIYILKIPKELADID